MRFLNHPAGFYSLQGVALPFGRAGASLKSRFGVSGKPQRSHKETT